MCVNVLPYCQPLGASGDFPCPTRFSFFLCIAFFVFLFYRFACALPVPFAFAFAFAIGRGQQLDVCLVLEAPIPAIEGDSGTVLCSKVASVQASHLSPLNSDSCSAGCMFFMSARITTNGASKCTTAV
jgi:hypothetical protein